jgi:hypothetical protein
MSAGAPLPIDGRANIGPDRFDLVHLQDAVPRRHVVLAADHRLDKAIVLAGAQSFEIERRPARNGVQLLAMAARAAVVIEGVALLDERLRGTGAVTIAIKLAVIIVRLNTNGNDERMNETMLRASTREVPGACTRLARTGLTRQKR